MKVIELFGDKLAFVGAEASLLLVSLEAQTPIKILHCADGVGHTIVSITVSTNRQKVYAAFSNKCVCCWDIQTAEALGTIVLKKRPTSIVYSSYNNKLNGKNRECLIASDKAGDIWAVDAALKKSVLVGGHTASVITDMAIHDNIIATADRDEKIRISRVPNVETIQAYCMGHVNVVCSTAFMEVGGQALLVSVGWDHQLCLWDFSNGSRLAVHSFQPTGPATATDADEAAAAAAVPAVPAAAAAAVPAVPALNPGGADYSEEPDEPAEKQYSEKEAGHFPFKVTVSRNSSMPIVAVTFKGLRSISLFKVQQSGSGGDFEFVPQSSIELEEVPVDAAITPSNTMIVVLPGPLFAKAYHVKDSNNSSSSSSSSCDNEVVAEECAEEEILWLNEYRKTCAGLGVNFSQQLMSSSAGGDAEEEMTKHVLDAPFAKEIHFKNKRAGLTLRKGEKRAMVEKERAEQAAPKKEKS